MNREERAIQKFEKTLTKNQQDVIRDKILREAFSKARAIMDDTYKARLFPSVEASIGSTARDIAWLMYQYGDKTRQLWGRDSEGQPTAFRHYS